LIDLNHDQYISRAELEKVNAMIEQASLKKATSPPETYEDFDDLTESSKDSER